MNNLQEDYMRLQGNVLVWMLILDSLLNRQKTVTTVTCTDNRPDEISLNRT